MTIKSIQSWSVRFSCIALLLPLVACGETIDPDPGVIDTADGDDDVGVNPGPLAQGECVTEPVEGVTGALHQCNGLFLANVGFTYQGQDLALYVPSIKLTKFGHGYEPYEQPKVMACCGPHDPDLDLYDQPELAENCLKDFRQQACMSIALNLKKLIDDGTVPTDYKSQAIEVQNWIADRTTQCINGLVDTKDSPTGLSARWDLPDDGPWGPDFSGVHLQIDIATLSGVYTPDVPATCTSLHDNDDVFFTKPPSPLLPGDNLTLTAGDGALYGPDLGQGPLFAEATFAALDTACVAPWCSTSTIWADKQGNWSIDAMQLRVAGDLRIGDDHDSAILSQVRLELQAPAAGHWAVVKDQPVYQVPAGAAHFVLVGQADGEWVTLPVPSSSPITAARGQQGWQLEPFTIDYHDDMGHPWTVAVGQSDWQ